MLGIVTDPRSFISVLLSSPAAWSHLCFSWLAYAVLCVQNGSLIILLVWDASNRNSQWKKFVFWKKFFGVISYSMVPSVELCYFCRPHEMNTSSVDTSYKIYD